MIIIIGGLLRLCYYLFYNFWLDGVFYCEVWIFVMDFERRCVECEVLGVMMNLNVMKVNVDVYMERYMWWLFLRCVKEGVLRFCYYVVFGL